MMKNKLSKLAGILGFAAILESNHSHLYSGMEPEVAKDITGEKPKRHLKPGMEVFEWADGFKCVARNQKSANRKYNNWLKAGKPEVKLNWE